MEMRFKVNVLLIPNVHLETPNYEIERLRSDSEKLDLATPSYQMVNRPVEEVLSVKGVDPESKPARPEPVVKGITPTQPAPIAAEPRPREAEVTTAAPTAEKPSLWKRFASLFGSEPAPQPPTVTQPTTPARQPRENRDGRGGDRPRRDGRDGRDGDRKRGDRKDRPGQSGAQNQERGPRNERNRPNEQREQRVEKAADPVATSGPEIAPQPQKPRPQQQPKAALEARPVDTGDEGEGRGRRRRGRGGRGGRDGTRDGREPRVDQNATPLNSQDTAASHESSTPRPDAIHTAETAPTAMSVSTPESANQEHAALPVVIATPATTTGDNAPSPAPVLEQSVVAASAPIASAYVAPASIFPEIVAAQTIVAAPVDQIDDPSAVRSTPRPARRRNRDVVASEPLVFIETVASPVTAVIQTVEEEAPRHRTPRPRGPRVAQTELLHFVETKNTVSNDGGDKTAV